MKLKVAILVLGCHGPRAQGEEWIFEAFQVERRI